MFDTINPEPEHMLHKNKPLHRISLLCSILVFMKTKTHETLLQHPAQFTSRKVQPPDHLGEWIDYYMHHGVLGIRSIAVQQKIELHLNRFRIFFEGQYGHSKISTCLKRDVKAWQKSMMADNLAHSTINNHLASLSGFFTWVISHASDLLPHGSPTKGVGELALPPLEPRALTEAQVRSLKSVCDRLSRFHSKKGRKWQGQGGVKAMARPLRDRAILFLMLSTGLRREEVVNLDLSHLAPEAPDELRRVKRARLTGVKGKGNSERTVFLSQDARLALADYLESERPVDCNEASIALFLSDASRSARKADGRLSVRSVNLILEQIGRWHDAEVTQEERKISPLRPHDLRHTFGFQLAQATSADSYELERRLGHRSQRYIQRYTNPPEGIAAGYVEEF